MCEKSVMSSVLPPASSVAILQARPVSVVRDRDDGGALVLRSRN